jgi:hypothetical protein
MRAISGVRVFGFLVTLISTLWLPGGALAAGATVTQDDPVDFVAWNDFTGEYVHLVGTAHTVRKDGRSAGGRHHVLYQSNARDVSGIGETSGLVYNATGQPARVVFTFDPDTDSGPLSFVNRQSLITQGATDNFILLREWVRFVQTPNGDRIHDIEGCSIVCTG